MKAYRSVFSMLPLAAALVLVATPDWSQAATAVQAESSAPSATINAKDKAFIKFSDAGNTAIQDIRAARFAIFNGQTSAASALIEGAIVATTKAKSDAPEFARTTSKSVDGKEVSSSSAEREAMSVPVDGQLLVSDDFVMTPEKKAHIDKANTHLKNGERSKAIEELKLADIDVGYSVVWMPMTSALKHLDQAMKFDKDGKYYEANLALKAIEDSLVVDTVNSNEVPQAQVQPAAK